MKILFLISALGLLACAGPVPVTPTSSSDLKTKFHLRPYTVTKWANGLEVITIESHGLPSVSFALLVKTGSASDPMAKSGLMNLVTSTMSRGTATRTADQIADQLGELGSDLDTETSNDYSWFEVSGLSVYQAKIFDVFSDVILHPKFERAEVDREKKQVLAAIEARADHPEQFAELAFQSYLFGGHPYGRPTFGSALDVRNLKSRDLADYYDRSVRPNNAILVVTGDLTPSIKAQISSTFENWEKKEPSDRVFANVPAISGVNIRLVDKPELTQSQVLLGHMGIRRSDPDHLALKVASLILGGDFSSRLMSQVRVKLGLTYGISSSFDPLFDRGPFTISTFTKNETVGAAISETLKVYKKFYDDGVTAEEVEDAENSLLGGFPRVIETPEHLGFNLALLHFYGVEDSYLNNFMQNVRALSTADINAVIKKHMTPNDMKILVLSKEGDALPQLKTLGLVEVKKFNEVF